MASRTAENFAVDARMSEFAVFHPTAPDGHEGNDVMSDSHQYYGANPEVAISCLR